MHCNTVSSCLLLSVRKGRQTVYTFCRALVEALEADTLTCYSLLDGNRGFSHPLGTVQLVVDCCES